MIPTGLSQVIEQFIRVFFMLAIAFLFVSWNKGSDVVTGGAMIGSCLGVITSLIYLRLKYVKVYIVIKVTHIHYKILKIMQKDTFGFDSNCSWSVIDAGVKFS